MIPSIKNISPTIKSSYLVQSKENPITSDGLVLHLDGKSYAGSGTTWTDISGVGNHATLVGSPTYNSSGYFTFGSGKYATLPNILSVGNMPYAVEAWVRPTSVNSTLQPIFYSAGSGNGSNLAMVLSAGNLFGINVGATPATQYHQTTPTANNWYHVVITRERGSAYSTYYYFCRTTVNCVPSTNVYLSDSTSISSSTPRVAGDQNNSNYFNGDIAVLRIYNKAISSYDMYKNFLYERDRFSVV